MTKRDKVVMISAAVLAILVVATTILQAATSAQQNRPVFWPVTIGIILLSLFSVVFVFIRRVRKSAYEKKLKPDFFNAYQGVKDALASSELPTVYQREALSDILELLLSAQGSGKTANSVIPNSKEFSRRILFAYSSKSRAGVIGLIDGCIAFLLFVLGSHTLLWLEQTGQDYFLVKTDASLVLFFIIIAICVLPFLRRLAVKQSIWAYILPLVTGILLIGLMEISRKFFYAIPLVKAILDGTVLMIPNAVLFGIYLLTIPLLLLLKSAIRRLAMRE